MIDANNTPSVLQTLDYQARLHERNGDDQSLAKVRAQQVDYLLREILNELVLIRKNGIR